MANELSLLLNLSVNKNNVGVSASTSLTETISGTNYQNIVQKMQSTAGEAISVVSDIGTGGWIMIKNVTNTLTDAGSTSAYIDVGYDSGITGNKIARLLVGEPCLIKPGTNTLYVKAALVDADVQVVVICP